MSTLIKDIKFLLDENVDNKLKVVFEAKRAEISTIQEEGWAGYKDLKLCQLIRDLDCVFVTRDKGFEFLWREFDMNVLFINIHPSRAFYIKDHLEFLLNNWQYDIDHPFFLRLETGQTRIWYKA